MKDTQVYYEMFKKLYVSSMKKNKKMQLEMKYEVFSGKKDLILSCILVYAEHVPVIEV